MARPLSSMPDRFWAKVDRTNGADSCWNWTAHTAWNGYGEFRMPTRLGKLVKSHRVAYELLVGPIPENMDLDHVCRNRACCNPAHLEPVNRSVNASRGLCGAHRSKLTPQDCREIKALRGVVSGAELASRYGVSKACISRVQLHYSDDLISKLDRFQLLDQHRLSP